MFLDKVWVEIYDDVSPMGDKNQYRDIVTALFIEGKDPHDIWITQPDGKKKRLSDTPRHKTTKADLDGLRALQNQAIELAKAREAEAE